VIFQQHAEIKINLGNFRIFERGIAAHTASQSIPTRVADAALALYE
jgi:hypothetical protein